MTVTKLTLFTPQLLVLITLVLVTLLGLNPQALVALLCVGLMGLWIAGAFVEPFSLLLSALALAGTTSVLSLLHINGVPFSVNGLLTAGLGAACALAVVVHFRYQFRTPRQIRELLWESAPLSLLLSWALLRTPSAPSLSNAISDILIWSTVILVYALARAYWFENPGALAAGETAFLYVAFLTLIVIVIDALLGNVFFNTTDRAFSPGLHTSLGPRITPQFFGLALVPLLGLLRFGHAPQRISRWLPLSLIAVLSAWIFFSLGRTSLLGAAGVVFPLMLLAPRTLWKAVVIVVVGVALTAVLIESPLYPRPKIGSLASVINVEDNDAIAEGGQGESEGRPRVSFDAALLRDITFGRSAAWEYLIEKVVNEHPILGFGTGASRGAVKEVISTWDNPHNDYLRIFFDFGAVGLLTFVLSWASRLLICWWTWVRQAPNTPVAVYNFVALVAGGYILLNFMTDNFVAYFYIMGPFGLLLAMATAATLHVEALEETEPPTSGAQPIPVEAPPQPAPEKNVQWDR